MKTNTFGIKDLTPGQNIVKAIRGLQNDDYIIGIPPYNYQKMYRIFDSILKAEEINILKKGFGFECDRVQQNEIAKELGWTKEQVSQTARKAIAKLQASPFKKQLLALEPSVEELYSLAETAMKSKAEIRTTKELSHRLENAQRNLDEANQRNRAMEAELSAKAYEVETLEKRVEAERKDKENASRKLARLEKTLKKVHEDFFGASTKNPLDSLGISQEAVNRLKKAGIHDVEALTRNTRRNLTKVGIGQDNIKSIEQALKSRGLYLRL